MLLSCETVRRTATACLTADDGRELAFRDLGGGEAEAGLALLLDGLLRTHGRPRALAIATGPGSFTGLRVGVTAIRTLAWLEDLPVHPVDALAAAAAGRGPGLWWVLLPITRDATAHGLYRVGDGGALEILAPPRIDRDASQPPLAAATGDATAVGPALSVKPDLAARWCPSARRGDDAPPDARGVARATAAFPAGRWDAVLPDYHREPAPVLQRAALTRPAPR
jgi:tRNA threonylcarbamoyladenosine biosynthesis protein TsaB